MPTKRLIRPLAQLLVILFAIALLFHFWHANPPRPAPVGGGDNDEDDVKYSPIVPVSVAPVTAATLRSFIVAFGTVEPAPATADQPSAGASIRLPAPVLVAEVDCIEGQQREARTVAVQSRRRCLAGPPYVMLDDTLGHTVGGPSHVALVVEPPQTQPALNGSTGKTLLRNIASPLAGTVVQINIRPGELAVPWTTAVQVVDLSRLVIALSVPGWQLRDIKLGQEAEILRQTKDSHPVDTTAPASQHASFMGKVIFIDPQVDTNTGMGSVDVAPPAEMRLRLGEFITVRIVSEEHKDCLTVPAVSLVKDANDNWGVSLAVRDFHAAVRHPVKVGIIESDRAEVSGEGIVAGAYVVTAGAAALPDKSKIEVVK